MNQQLSAEQIQQFVTSGIGIAIILGVVFFLVAIGCLICWFLASCLAKLPPEHRRQQPALAWLLLIPCFNVIWVFFVYPKIAESFQSYFAATGRTDVGDCGQKLAQAYCIGSLVSFALGVIGQIPLIGIPFALFNCLLGPAMFVVWIILLVKFADYKSQVRVP